jgi:ribonuclease HI
MLFLLCCGMTDLAFLLSAANKTERAHGRRLARRHGLSEEQGLREALVQAAGSQGLAQLLAERVALRAAEAARAATRAAGKAQALAARKARHDGPPTAWRAWFDGSAHPNPGRCGIGGVLKGPLGEHVEISQPAGHGNSSEAEYRALIAILEAAAHAGAHPLTVYGDSQVVVDDVNGSDADAAPSLRAHRAAALALIAQLPVVTLRWVPRHKNPEADALSQRAVNLAYLAPSITTDAPS